MKKYHKVLLIVILFFLGLILYEIYNNTHPKIELNPNHPDKDWEQGPLIHLIPTASHNRIIKASVAKPFSEPLKISVDGRIFEGVMTDTNGYFWLFDIQNLQTETTYNLIIQDTSGKELTDPWNIKTLPDPDSMPDRFKDSHIYLSGWS